MESRKIDFEDKNYYRRSLDQIQQILVDDLFSRTNLLKTELHEELIKNFKELRPTFKLFFWNSSNLKEIDLKGIDVIKRLNEECVKKCESLADIKRFILLYSLFKKNQFNDEKSDQISNLFNEKVEILNLNFNHLVRQLYNLYNLQIQITNQCIEFEEEMKIEKDFLNYQETIGDLRDKQGYSYLKKSFELETRLVNLIRELIEQANKVNSSYEQFLISDLPDVVLINVLNFLSLKEIINLKLVNIKLNNFITEKELNKAKKKKIDQNKIDIDFNKIKAEKIVQSFIKMLKNLNEGVKKADERLKNLRLLSYPPQIMRIEMDILLCSYNFTKKFHPSEIDQLISIFLRKTLINSFCEKLECEEKKFFWEHVIRIQKEKNENRQDWEYHKSHNTDREIWYKGSYSSRTTSHPDSYKVEVKDFLDPLQNSELFRQLKNELDQEGLVDEEIVEKKVEDYISVCRKHLKKNFPLDDEKKSDYDKNKIEVQNTARYQDREISDFKHTLKLKWAKILESLTKELEIMLNEIEHKRLEKAISNLVEDKPVNIVRASGTENTNFSPCKTTSASKPLRLNKSETSAKSLRMLDIKLKRSVLFFEEEKEIWLLTLSDAAKSILNELNGSRKAKKSNKPVIEKNNLTQEDNNLISEFEFVGANFFVVTDNDENLKEKKLVNTIFNSNSYNDGKSEMHQFYEDSAVLEDSPPTVRFLN